MRTRPDKALIERAVPLDPPVAPAWAAELMSEDCVEEPVLVSAGAVVRVREDAEFTLLRATVPGAKGLPDAEFRVCVERTYLLLRELLGERDRKPLRFWNYVPGITARAADGLSRYELFNLGRYLAYTRWYETVRFGECLAAASAVDHRGEDLVVHVLAGSHPGSVLENPRQTPAWRYSRRYGPLPPCFSRATVLRHASAKRGEWAIVAGTGSIVGEDARHAGNCDAQLEETLLNLAYLAAALDGGPLPSARSFDSDRRAHALARYRCLRAYVVREADAGRVVAGLRRAFPGIDEVEVCGADLCRPELLVEVEGILCAAAGSGRGAARPPK